MYVYKNRQNLFGRLVKKISATPLRLTVISAEGNGKLSCLQRQTVLAADHFRAVQWYLRKQSLPEHQKIRFDLNCVVQQGR